MNYNYIIINLFILHYIILLYFIILNYITFILLLKGKVKLERSRLWQLDNSWKKACERG